MTEAQVGLLLKVASTLSHSKNAKINQILKSYYMMRCKQITKGFGLPKQQFSEEVRCARCCIEWNNQTKIETKQIKLSKAQRKRKRLQAKKKKSQNDGHLLHCNKLVKTCSFCGESIEKILLKPNRLKENQNKQKQMNSINNTEVKDMEEAVKKKDKIKNNTLQSSVYCKSKVAFSLNGKKNIIPATVKEPPKIIKNNKKKKDKFAGLCQTAVNAAAKLKQGKGNKLNLFLKPTL